MDSQTGWHHLGKWIEPALAAETWLNYGKYAQIFFKEQLDGRILYLNGNFFLSQHDVDIIKKESYESAKNKNQDFFKKIRKEVTFVSKKIVNKSKKITSPIKFIKEYEQLTGIWMPLNIVSLGVEKYINEIDPSLFTIASGDTIEKPLTLKQLEEMRKIKEGIKEIPNSINNLPEKIQRKIKTHLKKYEWKGSHHFLIHQFTESELFNQMKEDRFQEKIEKPINSEKKELIKLLDLMGFVRFKAAEASGTSTYNLSKQLNRLAQMYNLTYEELLEHTLEEIKNKEISKEIAEKRKKSTGFLFDKKVKILTDKETKEYENLLLKQEKSNSNLLKGLIACKGKVKGKVKIVRSKREMEGFEEGMILVAYETTPDIIVAMKKAAAIITDFGGLTSHAAIVAREFKIPCIVGTKIATKSLKDGDLVEVDANKGTIRKEK